MPQLSRRPGHTLLTQVNGGPNLFKTGSSQAMVKAETQPPKDGALNRAPSSSEEEEPDELLGPQPGSPPGKASLQPNKRRKLDASKAEPEKLKPDPSSDVEPFGQRTSSQRRGWKTFSRTQFQRPKSIKTKYDDDINREKKAEKTGFKQPRRLKAAGEYIHKPDTVGTSSTTRTPKDSKDGVKDAQNSPKPAENAQSMIVLPEAFKLMKVLKIPAKDIPSATAHNVSTTSLHSQSPTTTDSSSLSSLTEFADEDVSTSLDVLAHASFERLEVAKKCPVCKKKVLASTWKLFTLGIPKEKREERLNTRHQVQFCRYHKKNSARAEWKKRKYPNIDWGEIPIRVAALKDDIESVIDGTEPSIYAEQLNDQRKGESGRRRKVASEFSGDFGSDSVGYYGGRGAQIIGIEVANLFTNKFLDDTQHDIIAAAGGIPMYIQKVIVPEVASRLIAQDMKCELSTARDILTQSADLGQLLSEELDDEVPEDELPEDEVQEISS